MTVSVLWTFLTVLWVSLQCVIVVFPDYTNFLTTFLTMVVSEVGLVMRKCVSGVYEQVVQTSRLTYKV